PAEQESEGDVLLHTRVPTGRSECTSRTGGRSRANRDSELKTAHVKEAGRPAPYEPRLDRFPVDGRAGVKSVNLTRRGSAGLIASGRSKRTTDSAPRRRSGGRRSATIVEPPERAADRFLKLLDGDVDGDPERFGLVRHRDRLQPRQPRLEHAAHVRAAFDGVLVGEVRLHASDAVGEVRERAFDLGLHTSGEALPTLHVLVGVHLNLHGLFSNLFLLKNQRDLFFRALSTRSRAGRRASAGLAVASARRCRRTSVPGVLTRVR